MCLLPAGQNLPFVQYIATLAIVQAVQQLAQQRLQVQPCAILTLIIAGIPVKLSQVKFQ